MGKTLAIVCAAVATTYLILSSMISVRGMEDPVGPRMYPLLLGVGMVIVAGMLWRDAQRPAPADNSTIMPDMSQRRSQRIGVIGAAAAAFAYTAMMEDVGYLVGTFILMLGLLIAFNRGKYLTNVAIAAGTSAVLYYGLKKFLGVPLPSGIFGFLG